MNTEPDYTYRRPVTNIDAAELAESQPMVEHLTVTEFMQRIPHPNRWHLDDINRFGDKVGWTARSIQLARMMVQSPSLGLIQVFPVPLLQRIYTILAPQFNWPTLPAVLEARKAAGLHQANERIAQHLQGLAIVADPEVQQHIAVVLEYLAQQRTPRS